jgi:hypothetical protein
MDYYTGAERKAVASEIMHQLGGNKFKAMVNAKNLVFGTQEEDNRNVFLAFKFMKSDATKARFVRITLDYENDVYIMQFFYFKRVKDLKLSALYGSPVYTKIETTVKIIEGVYNDMLPDIFEKVTGLYVNL